MGHCSHLHDVADVCAQDCCECSLGYVFFDDAYLLVCFCHVKFQPKLGMGNIMSDVVLIREGCDVLHCVVILQTEIKHRSQHAWCLFRDREHGYHLSCGGWYPPSSGCILLDLLEQLLPIMISAFGQTVVMPFVQINENNLMIYFPPGGQLQWDVTKDVPIFRQPLLLQCGNVINRQRLTDLMQPFSGLLY